MKHSHLFWGLVGMALIAGACTASRPSGREERANATGTAGSKANADSTVSSSRSVRPAETSIALDWRSPRAVRETCKARIERIEALRKAVTSVDPSRALMTDDLMRREIDRVRGAAGLLGSVHPDVGVQDAAEQCERDLEALGAEIRLDRAVYEALAATERSKIDRWAERSLDKTLRDFKRAGVDRDEATRAKLKKLSDDIIRVGQEFSRAIREDVRSIRVQPAALDGLPADFIASHPPDTDGRVTITTSYPDFFPVQRYAKRESVRRDLYLQYLNRGYPANDQYLAELLQLRREYAHTLGYPTWADYDAADKMAKTSARIADFIGELESIAGPRNERDLQVLLARKRKDDPGAKHVQVWDRFYYVDRVRAEEYDFDAQSVRPYFEFERVTAGLLSLYGELFDVRFETDPEAPVWHPSVKAYRLYSGDELIGRFYLDMHPRPGKYGHAAMFPIQTGVRRTAGRDGQLAIASLVCNFPDPGKTSPALMEHQQVVTYFHEFGHLVHHLLANGSPWVTLGGISTEWDFVEAPSQLLEEWAWDPTVLARFAHHIETNEPIPASMVERMRRSSEFGKGIHVQRQLYYTALSFYLYTADPSSLDLSAFERETMKKYSPFPYPPGTHGYASFGHLSGYTSAYYTYQWSLVLAKDIFTRFDAEGLLSPKTARDYRQAILMPGGSKDAAALVGDFLGRPSTIDAYRAWLDR